MTNAWYYSLKNLTFYLEHLLKKYHESDIATAWTCQGKLNWWYQDLNSHKATIWHILCPCWSIHVIAWKRVQPWFFFIWCSMEAKKHDFEFWVNSLQDIQIVTLHFDWFTENRKLSGESDTLIWFRFNSIDSWLSFLCERAVQSWPCAAVFNRIAEADRLWATSFYSLPQQTLTAHEKEPTCFPVEEMALSVNEPVAFSNRNPKWLCAQSGMVRFMSGC